MAIEEKKSLRRSAVGILDQIGRGQVLLAIFGLTAPSVATILAIIGGISQHFPVMWIVMAAALAFFGTIGGIYFIYQIWLISTPLNKLRYVGTIVPCDFADLPRRDRRSAGPPQPRRIERLQLGVQLQNVSHFPISAYIEAASTEFDGHTPPRTVYPKPPTEILPGNAVVMVDDIIDMGGILAGPITGRMYLKIRYGEPKNEKLELTFNATVSVIFTPQGAIQSLVTNWTPV